MSDDQGFGAMPLALTATAQRSSTPRNPATLKDNGTSDVLLNQYYTREDIASRLYNTFCKRFDPASFLMVEPSAGGGAFLRLLPVGSLAFDLDPKCAGIETADFLAVQIHSEKPIAIIGNPPFSNGRAVKFFNHAAPQSQVIALILPRSFRKAAIENKLNRDFHLLHEEDVENDAFIFRSKPFHAPARFQIWVRRAVRRKLRDAPTTHPDFDFLPTSEHADFAIQRVGSRAGRIHGELKRSRQAHYFIRANRSGVEDVMRQLDFGAVAGDVAGNPSLAMTEIVRLYSEWMERRKVA